MAFFLNIFLIFSSAWAQQSYFNVPSSQQTEKEKFFFQDQANFTRDGLIVNNITLDYGLFKNLEVGLNYLGQSAQWKGDADVPDDELMVNAQYFWHFSEQWTLAFGAQLGEVSGEVSQLGRLMYMNFQWAPSSETHITFGIAQGDEVITNDNVLLFQAGLDTPIVRDQLLLIADYISGDTQLSVGVIGVGIVASKNWVISAGYQFPARGSDNPTGIVLEFTSYPHH